MVREMKEITLTPGELQLDLNEYDPEHAQVMLQEVNEERFNRKHIDAKIKHEIESTPEAMERLAMGVELLKSYINGQYYESKMIRMTQLKLLKLEELVMDLFIGVAYYLRPELYPSATAQLAARLKFNDKVDAITTVGEMLAVLAQTDMFDIVREKRTGTFMVVSRMGLPDNLISFIENSQYLPPMVCEPLELTHNYSSGYLTHNDSLILGSGNHHDGDICLDTLNIMNSVALKLDLDFLCKVEEEPTHALETQDQQDNWARFKRQSYYFYSLMQQQGNCFHLTHKVDKRGRAYACGYHINTQGAPFKKAMLELANEEIVEGVPDDAQIHSLP